MDFPAGWTETRIEEVLLPFANGQTLRQGWSPQCEAFPSRTAQEWGVLKTTAVQDGAFLEQHNKQLPSGLEPDENLEVERGDLLLTCAGPRARCGVVCLVRKTRPRLMASGKMYRFRPEPRIVLAEFLEAFLRSHDTKKRIDAMKTGISDSGLNLTLASIQVVERSNSATPRTASNRFQDRGIVLRARQRYRKPDACSGAAGDPAAGAAQGGF